MDKVKNYLRLLPKRMENVQFPYISVGIASFGLAAAKMIHNKNIKANISNIFLNLITEQDEKIPILPTQTEPKPVIIFDHLNFLTNVNFSLFSFDFLVKKRPFYDIFIFHTAHLYELIHVTDVATEFNRKLIKNIDRYGCISYKLYCKNKKDFTLKELNRPLENVVVIATEKNEYNKCFEDNSILIDKWDGSPNTQALDLTNFFYNLYFAKIDDFRATLRSYKNKNFFKSFDQVQKKIFKMRNMFKLNCDSEYNKRISEINQMRIKDFEKAKISMEKDIKEEKKESYNFLKELIGIVAKSIF